MSHDTLKSLYILWFLFFSLIYCHTDSKSKFLLLKDRLEKKV